MKTKYINRLIVTFALIASCMMWSCGDGTDDIVPGEGERNYFEPDPSDHSKAADLRRDFYEKNGIYLLFNDLLGTYTDRFGNEREERVDFNWGLTSYTSYKYTFDEIEEEDLESVVDKFSRYFLPYINIEGGSLRPYSIMLVNNICTNEEYEDEMEEVSFISSFRCIGVNMSGFIGVDDEDAKYVGKDMLKDLVDDKMNKDTPELAPFFEISQEYYDDYYIMNHIPEWWDEQNEEWVYERGFLYYIKDYYGEVDYDMFPNEKNDLKKYMDAIFNMDEDEFIEKWSDYPLIMRKYEMLKECVREVGIDLNAVK